MAQSRVMPGFEDFDDAGILDDDDIYCGDYFAAEQEGCEVADGEPVVEPAAEPAAEQPADDFEAQHADYLARRAEALAAEVESQKHGNPPTFSVYCDYGDPANPDAEKELNAMGTGIVQLDTWQAVQYAYLAQHPEIGLAAIAYAYDPEDGYCATMGLNPYAAVDVRDAYFAADPNAKTAYERNCWLWPDGKVPPRGNDRDDWLADVAAFLAQHPAHAENAPEVPSRKVTEFFRANPAILVVTVPGKDAEGNKQLEQRYNPFYLLPRTHPKTAPKPAAKLGSPSAKQPQDGEKKQRKKGVLYVETQFADEHFIGWTPTELAALEAARNGDIAPMAAVFCARIDAVKGVELVEQREIIHDSDFYTIDDNIKDVTHTAGAHKTDHGHFMFRFSDPKKGMTCRLLARTLGVAEQMVEQAKYRGRDGEARSWDNKSAYLIHAKDPEKHQYDPEQVHTMRGIDYMTIYEARKVQWERDRSGKMQKGLKRDLPWLCDEIKAGRIIMENIMASDELYAIYSANIQSTAEVKNAMYCYGERRLQDAVDALKAKEFRKVMIFITGTSGCGKGILLDALCAMLNKLYGWIPDTPASKNPFDEYAKKGRGAEILVLDEVRGATMDVLDWLRLLDPVRAFPPSARYKNLPDIAPRVIIITSSKPPLEFFYYAQGIGGGDRSENMGQFFRRIAQLVHVLNPMDYGFYNVDMYRPRRINGDEAYSLKLPPSEKGTYSEVSDLGYQFMRSGYADGLDSMYSAVAELLFEIDAKQKNRVIKTQADRDAVAAEAARTLSGFLRDAMTGDSSDYPEMVLFTDGAQPRITDAQLFATEWTSFLATLPRNGVAVRLPWSNEWKDVRDVTCADWVRMGRPNAYAPRNNFDRRSDMEFDFFAQINSIGRTRRDEVVLDVPEYTTDDVHGERLVLVRKPVPYGLPGGPDVPRRALPAAATSDANGGDSDE